MQNALQAALQCAEVSRARFAPKQQPATRPCPPKTERISLREGEKFVIVFGCLRSKVPAKIQVLRAVGGYVSSSPNPEGVQHFRKARITLSELMARCTVESINAVSDGTYCRVYLNCTAATAGEGLKHWSGVYENFVRENMQKAWNKATFRQDSTRTMLSLHGARDELPEVKLRFALKEGPH